MSPGNRHKIRLQAPTTSTATCTTSLRLSALQIEGLMAMALITEEPDDARPYFAEARTLRDDLEAAFGIKLPALSMGMSGDYTAAIKEGATMVRVGTAIFGARSMKNLRASDALGGD